MLDRPTLRELRDALVAGGAAAADEAAFRAALDAPGHEAPTPWFVRVLMGFGAWVSALLFAIAAAISGIGDSTRAMFAVGLLGFVAGTLLRRSGRGAFVVQLALAASIGGRGLVYGATIKANIATWGGSHESSTLAAMLVLEAVAMLTYPDVVGRFVATLGVCFAAVALPIDLRLGAAPTEMVVVAIAAAAAALWWFEPKALPTKYGALVAPVGFGLVTSLLFAVATVSWSDFDWVHHEGGRAPLVGIGIGLTVLTLAIAWRVVGELRTTPAAQALAYGGTLAFGAMALKAPGLMGAVLVMALAIGRRHRLLFGLAALSLVMFGSKFYDDLDMTLLAKSGVLAGTGVLLLALRIPLARAATSATGTATAMAEEDAP